MNIEYDEEADAISEGVMTTMSRSFDGGELQMPSAKEQIAKAFTASSESNKRRSEAERVYESRPHDAEGFNPNGVIDDPDGYVNLRKEKSADSPIIAKVRKDEPFEFECKQNETWCKVKLASGVTGWMHYSRIKRWYTEKDPPRGPEDSGDRPVNP